MHPRGAKLPLRGSKTRSVIPRATLGKMTLGGFTSTAHGIGGALVRTHAPAGVNLKYSNKPCISKILVLSRTRPPHQSSFGSSTSLSGGYANELQQVTGPRYVRLLHLCFLSFCFVTTCERGNSFCVRRQQFKYLMMGEAAESRKLAHLAPTVTSEVRFSSFYSSFERMARLHTFGYSEKGQNKDGYYADKARNLGTCQSFALFCPCVKS